MPGAHSQREHNGMQRLIALVIATAGLTACSTTSMESLPPEMSLTSGDPQYIQNITFEYPAGPATADAFEATEACVLENANNGIERNNKGDTVGDGQIIQTSNPERGYIVAKGVVTAQEGMIYRMITYQVRVSAGPPRKYRFTSIKQGIGSYMEEDMDSNFTPVGAWSGAKPLTSFGAIKEAASAINDCIESW